MPANEGEDRSLRSENPTSSRQKQDLARTALELLPSIGIPALRYDRSRRSFVLEYLRPIPPSEEQREATVERGTAVIAARLDLVTVLMLIAVLAAVPVGLALARQTGADAAATVGVLLALLGGLPLLRTRALLRPDRRELANAVIDERQRQAVAIAARVRRMELADDSDLRYGASEDVVEDFRLEADRLLESLAEEDAILLGQAARAERRRLVRWGKNEPSRKPKEGGSLRNGDSR